MLTNCLRILFIKVMTKRMQKRSRKYLNLYKDEEGTCYCARPMMALEIAGNARAFLPIFLGMVLITIIGEIWYVIKYFWKGETELNNDLSMLIVLLLMCGLTIFYFYSMHRYERTKCLFRNKDICIKRYLHKDKIVTYEEVKQCLRERKLRVHNGNFEYPYKGGVIKIHTADGSLPEAFYRFMNQRCGWKMPRVSKKDKAVVRRTGIGRAFYTCFGIPFLLFAFFALLLSVVGDFGVRHSLAEIKNYLLEIIAMPQGYIWVAIAGFFLILGLILKVIYYFMAKYHFRSWDGVKVTLF